MNDLAIFQRHPQCKSFTHWQYYLNQKSLRVSSLEDLQKQQTISQVEEDPDNLGWAKESANAVIEGSLNIGKDALPG